MRALYAMGEPDYLDTAAVAALVGVQPASITRYRHRDPTFPSPDITLGGRPGWKRETIDTWIANHKGPGRPPKQTTHGDPAND